MTEWQTPGPDGPRTALVTGATSGIGRAITSRLVGEGWTVFATGRRAERLASLVDSLPTGKCVPLTFDIGSHEARARAIKAFAMQSKALDVLVNNAGLALGIEPAHEIDPTYWDTMIQTNISGLVGMTHALLPYLIPRSGLIINLSSIAATYPYHGGNVYGATKAFVRQFSLGLRCDLRGTGVRVTSIEPGMVNTEFTSVRRNDPNAGDTLYAGAEPLLAEDVAEMVSWIASQPARVNINAIEVMPTRQTWAGFHVERMSSK